MFRLACEVGGGRQQESDRGGHTLYVHLIQPLTYTIFSFFSRQKSNIILMGTYFRRFKFTTTFLPYLGLPWWAARPLRKPRRI